ncbi:hypothetical protein Tco_0762039 [Tanacetum coccineum]
MVFTIHRLSHHSPLVKTKGFCQLKGKMDNSRALVHDGRVLKVISSILIGQDKKECHVDTKEAQGNVGFYSTTTHKTSTNISITDCHAGNPCEIVSDPRAKINSSIIEKLYGGDKRERVEQEKARRFTNGL